MGTFFTPQKRKKPTNQVVEVDVVRCDHEGNGIAYIPDAMKAQRKSGAGTANKICFVSGAMPEERVKARIVQEKASVAHAHTVSVQTPSSKRQTPDCQHAAECGGCQLAHWEFSAQVDFKQDAVDALLQKSLTVDSLPWLPPLAGDTQRYRRRARVATWWNNKNQQLVVGFRAEKSKKIIPIQDCLVLSHPFETFFSQLSPVINRLKKAKFISHIELIDALPSPVVIFRHTQPLLERDAELLATCCEQNGWLALGESDNHQLTNLLTQNRYADVLHYTQQLTVNDADISLNQYFRPADFIQVNSDINHRMVEQALHWLAPNADDHILDLFCGIGNFSLPLALQAKEVIGVEGSQSMVEHATDNAKRNDLKNLRFYCADLNSDWKNAPWLGSPVSKILLDPARVGAMGATSQLIKIKAKQVLYVSCHPVTFARDARELCAAGYRIEKLNLIHMFPNTAHVEMMALFVL